MPLWPWLVSPITGFVTHLLPWLAPPAIRPHTRSGPDQHRRFAPSAAQRRLAFGPRSHHQRRHSPPAQACFAARCAGMPVSSPPRASARINVTPPSPVQTSSVNISTFAHVLDPLAYHDYASSFIFWRRRVVVECSRLSARSPCPPAHRHRICLRLTALASTVPSASSCSAGMLS